MWLGGLFCMFSGMMLLMHASAKLPALRLKNKWQAAAYGCGATAVIQSSSAVSCSVCALVESGKMELFAAYAVLVGSNVGTCVTPLLTALGLQTGDKGLFFALLGLLALLWQKRYPRLAPAVAGFCLLMWGMTVLTMEPEFFKTLAENKVWRALLSHPLGAWAVGLLVTAVLQSSSLTVGLLQVYALTAPLTLGTALPFILGQNIGTTATALIATAGEGPAAQKAARYHLTFNLWGNVWALPIACLLYPYLTLAVTPLALALCHLIFNVVSALLHLLWDRKLEN